MGAHDDLPLHFTARCELLSSKRERDEQFVSGNGQWCFGGEFVSPLGFRAQATCNQPAASNSGTIVSVVCLIPIGVVIALLTLYLLRGTKGALLMPVAEVVQVENPYGIAFACTAAAFFSDRILSWLSTLVDRLPVRR